MGLAPAGAGLPPVRLFLAKRVLMPLLRSVFTFEKALERFELEGQKIVASSRPLDRKRLFERVLVEPLFGLEDNSRYYSVAMVLEHLLRVGEALESRLPLMSCGEVPKREVRIEAYKPYVLIDEDIVNRYSLFIEGFADKIKREIDDIDSCVTYAHPWFGPLDLKGWMVMGMVHQIVHRRQIEAILRKIDGS